MTSEQHLPGPEPDDSPQKNAQTLEMIQPDSGIEGGDPACWACMVCEECGAVVSEGHRAGCSQAGRPAASQGAAPPA
jgi:hypothetical protein